MMRAIALQANSAAVIRSTAFSGVSSKINNNHVESIRGTNLIMEALMSTDWKAGLEDVIAARSAICAIDGAAGRLFYRGYEIGDLAGTVPFEDVTALLWSGELPSSKEGADFRARLADARGLPAPVADLLRTLPRECHPLDALRTGMSLAAALDPDARASDPAANLRKSFRVMNRVPEIV